MAAGDTAAAGAVVEAAGVVAAAREGEVAAAAGVELGSHRPAISLPTRASRRRACVGSGGSDGHLLHRGHLHRGHLQGHLQAHGHGQGRCEGIFPKAQMPLKICISFLRASF
jgi:hypothetical protein